MRALAMLCGAVAAACGGESEPVRVIPDAAGGGYVVDTREGPVDGPAVALVAYVNGDRWLAAREAEPGLYVFPVTGPTVDFAIVCTQGDIAEVRLEHRTPEPDRRLVRSCAARVDETVEVEVSVEPSDAALFIGTDLHAGGGSVRTIRVGPGTWDVAATTPSRVHVQRGVTLPTGSRLSLDVGAQGVDLEPLSIGAPSVDDDERVITEYALVTELGTFVPVRTAKLLRVPASITAPGDRHGVRITAQAEWPWPDGLAERWVTPVAATPEEAASDAVLPPRIAKVMGWWDDRLEVSWRGRVASDQSLRVELGHAGPAPRTWTATFSSAWLRLRGRTIEGEWAPPELSRVPGWHPGWALDRAEVATARWALRATSDEAVGIWGAASGVRYGGAFVRD
jgi:hypothetical protein